jgi:hypothetical protein
VTECNAVVEAVTDFFNNMCLPGALFWIFDSHKKLHSINKHQNTKIQILDKPCY